MINEIGSEFWSEEWDKSKNNKFFQEDRRNIFFLSGRTALDYIIRDAKAEGRLETIYLPSYCCHTMIEPFLKNKINVRFYNVHVNEKGGINYEIPEVKFGEALYIIKYFGYTHNYPKTVFNVKKKGNLIIEDETHSRFSKVNKSFADYTFTSFRKWMYLSGVAVVTKNNSDFLIPLTDKINERYVTLRNEAATCKRNFIFKGIGEKETFLQKYILAEKYLEIDYQDYRADREAVKKLEAIDLTSIAHKRRLNAKILLSGLKEVENIYPIFNYLSNDDVPLFVPIIVKDKMRDGLRKYLINRDIYCPVHWPLSDIHDGISEVAKKLYFEELSLVCDQRYDAEDMKRIIKEIKNFFRYNSGGKNE